MRKPGGVSVLGTEIRTTSTQIQMIAFRIVRRVFPKSRCEHAMKTALPAFNHERQDSTDKHQTAYCQARSPECERCPVAGRCRAPEKKARLADYGSPTRTDQKSTS